MSDSRQRMLLEQLSDGGFHSGEQLAQLLGISRTAIWKQIDSLRKKYHLAIHAVHGKGYRLADSLELLDARKIHQGLSRPQQQMLGLLQLHISIDSTNSHLQTQLSQGLESGSVCLSEHQSAGRGRRGRAWVSPFGRNLYFSLYWRFERSMAEVAGVSLAAGAALAGVLSGVVANVTLKWPNDLLIDGKKVAGILVDVQGTADGPVDVVLGVGVNLHLPAHMALQIDQPWTDIARQGGKSHSRNRLAARLIGELLESMRLFEQRQLEPFVTQWRQYDHYFGKEVVLMHSNRKIRGIHRGVADDGSLLLEVDGKLARYQSGEVTLRGA